MPTLVCVTFVIYFFNDEDVNRKNRLRSSGSGDSTSTLVCPKSSIQSSANSLMENLKEREREREREI